MCSKLPHQKWTVAVAHATLDERIHHDKRKVYWCRDCTAYHVSREKVNTDVSILNR